VAFRADGDRPAEGLVSLEAGGRRLTARLIAGEFIRYQARFPADFGCCAELPAGPLIEAVRRAALVAERAGPVRLSFTPGKVVIEAHAEGRARAAETVSADFTGEQTVISFNPHFLLDGLTAAEGLARSPEVVAAAAAASDEAAAAVAAIGAEAGGGREAGEAARAQEDAAIGRIRLEFTSPAKPALITWVGDEGLAADEDGGESRGPAFRYLLVPLRAPVRT
jgi:DNA polymerase III sliding clamp (beta) subunit (PCNA family)